MFSSPGINTNDANENTVSNTGIQSNDPTAQLNIALNSVKQIPYTTPSFNRAVIWTNGDVGLDDRQYNVGYKQVPVDNQVAKLFTHFESPELPVTQLPFNESINKSAQKIIDNVPNKMLFSLRAPDINEGF
jgi:hypothetical protein